jgi:hypothetical protein
MRMLALTSGYALLRKHTDVPFPAHLLRLEATVWKIWKATSKAKSLTCRDRRWCEIVASVAADKARPGVPRSPGLNNLSSLDRRVVWLPDTLYRTR